MRPWTRWQLPARPDRPAAPVLRTLLLISLALPGGAPLASTVAPAPLTHATVLLYHKFEEPQYPTTNISAEEFRRQLSHLRDNDYRVLDMAEFRRHLENGEPFPARSVLITIDDPYRSIHDVAWPILQEFGYPFTVFVWTKGVEGDYTALMSWDEIAELSRAGVTIGNHSHSHPRLGTPDPGEDPEAYAARVRTEIETARDILARRGVDSDLFAYPYGEYNRTVVEAARSAGYRMLFSQDPGAVDERTSTDRIPRAALVGAEQTLEDFVEKLSYSPLEVADVRPPYGFLDQNPPGAIELRIVDPGRYEPAVNVFVSEWSRVSAGYDPETGVVRFRPRSPLDRPTNRIIVTVRDRTTRTFSMYAQMVIRPFAELAGPGK